MDQWNQRMMFSQGSMPPGIPQNAGNQQNFYGPPNAQQFYPNAPGAQFQSTFPARPVFVPTMNTRPSNLLPSIAAQTQRPVNAAELESLKKKRNFEEQQKRLMALKQRGGSSMPSRVDNPLNDLFGQKGNREGMTSLLGPLGDVSRSKGSTVGFQGQPGHLMNIPSSSSVNIAASNCNRPVANVSSPAEKKQPSAEIEQFQAFNTKPVQDDFGDFQKSSGIHYHPEKGNALETQIPIEKTAEQNINVANMEDNTEITGNVHQPAWKVNSPSALSIDDLMKKSLTLDTQNSGRKFEKLKITKTIKSQPSHFAESSKASKFENLDSLSEMFTIPQSALFAPAQSAQLQSHVNEENSDDWSDFSAADETMFQIQKPSFEQGPSTSQSILVMMEGSNDSSKDLFHDPMKEMDPLPSGMSLQHTGMWVPHVDSIGFNQIPNVTPIPVSQDCSGMQDQATNNNFTSATLTTNQGEEKEVDPEQHTYGVSLPVWCKNSKLLPAVYKQIHEICSSNDIISTSQLYPILLSSDVPRDKLGHIWSKCNKAVPGVLNEQELYLMLGMVALAQAGLQVNKLTLEKLTSCVTAPIPSFPENIFQNESQSSGVSHLPMNTTSNNQNEQTTMFLAESISSQMTSNDIHPAPMLDPVKNPDWSKWKTSKASQIDDKFSDFQMLMPKDNLSNFSVSTTIPSVNWKSSSVTTNVTTSVSNFLSLTSMPSLRSGTASSNQDPPSTVMSEGHSLFGELQTSHEGSQLYPYIDANNSKTDVFGDVTGASDSFKSYESKRKQNSGNIMSVPLQASQRYTLTDDEDSIDYHEKAWLKCLSSCFTVITKSCQTLKNITDPGLLNEIFTSNKGISHFSAIIKVYCVSQRIKASVLRSAPNNKKLKESLQNIDNVWKTCSSFEPFKKLLPMENINFSACHINDDDDPNVACGVCLLSVDKGWNNFSANRTEHGKLSYGSGVYHTTCANFWCNRVDSVLPCLQLNFANSLI